MNNDVFCYFLQIHVPVIRLLVAVFNYLVSTRRHSVIQKTDVTGLRYVERGSAIRLFSQASTSSTYKFENPQFSFFGLSRSSVSSLASRIAHVGVMKGEIPLALDYTWYYISIPSALKILRYDLTLCTARRQVIVFFFI
jgi:hypothetical protein